MDSVDTTLKVNKLARRKRHMKVFSKKHLAKIQSKDVLKVVAAPAYKLLNLPALKGFKSILKRVLKTLSEVIPSAPKKKLMFQAIAISSTALLVTSFTPGGSFAIASMEYSNSYISAYELPGDVLVADEDGYLVKINPQTNDSTRIGLTDYATHTVESGETLSQIAEEYGVNTNTVMWENKLASAHSLRTGQLLKIPPVSGISYTVGNGDTIDKIASKYDIEQNSIIAQNALDGSTVVKGQNLFLPGAEPLAPPVTVANNYRSTGVTRDYRTTGSYSSANAAPAVGKMFIYPTRGKVTQGYHGGHYALDIADRSKPPIWSAASGTVSKVSVGTWGGGYGNHIIVNHGDGIQTLYAHLDSVNVSVGDWVGQGDVLGIMGNTGRVYGATGIHLHWEVHINGVKYNPYNYF